MKTVFALVKRNIKLFFKDKGVFFTSLITPAILLVLYATFLGNVYRDSFLSSLPVGFTLTDKVINGYVGSQLIASLLAVSCVTVAFCSNMIMVQDKASGCIKDIMISPVKPSLLALGYYFATLISTLIVSLFALVLCIGYISFTGMFITFTDILLMIGDVFLLVMFGTALSSIINFFLSTQGQISAVGTIVSSGYGFICGAYMPISQFSEGLQRVISFLPGTYGTALLKNHAMSGVFAEIDRQGMPVEAITEFKKAIDCQLYFFDHEVSLGAMYVVMALTVAVLIGVYILLNCLKSKKV